MAVTLTGQVIDTGTSGNILTSNGAGILPSFQAVPTTIFGPTFSLQGFNQTVPGGTVITLMGSFGSYAAPEKACTIYLMTFSIASSSAAQSVSIQPYGASNAGVGNLLGTATVITTSSTMTYYSQAESIAINPGGYFGVGVTPTSSTNIQINVQLWTTQSGI